MRNRHKEPGVRIRVKFDTGFDPQKLSNIEVEHLSVYLGEIVREMLLQSVFQDDQDGKKE